MENNRRKELMAEYKNRKPEKGVIAFRCTPTGDLFIGIAKDTKADINSNSFQLKGGAHSNKTLQALWNTHGEGGFEIQILQTLEYDDPKDDHTADLQALLELCFEENQGAVKLR